MSDLSIPGVKSKYDTQKIIDALMEVKKAPLKRKEEELDLYTREKSSWQNLNRQLTGLQTASRALYSFQNPFTEKIASSSDGKMLTAKASREAYDQKKEILVTRVATADRLLSRSLAKDFTVEAGDYAFQVGEKEAKFSYKGGSLKDFADSINRRAGTLLQASVVNDTRDSQVLLIEAKETGSKNRLLFKEKAVDMAVKAGIVERITSTDRQIELSRETVEAWTRPVKAGETVLKGGTLLMNPGSEAKAPLEPPAELGADMVLEFLYRTYKIPEEPVQEVKPPPGPTLPSTGSVEFQGIRIENEPSKAILPDWNPPKARESVTDMQVFYLDTGAEAVPLPEIRDSEEFQKVQVEVGKRATVMAALALRNRNTHRQVEIRDVVLYDKTQRGDYKPLKPLSAASDAVISMDGIEVTRSKNAVDDLIPGVTLNLLKAGDDPVELEVGRDTESIKKQIISLIGSYNRIAADIDILTRRDESVIEDLDYLSDEEKKAAKERLGLLFGDLTLQQLKSSLQRTLTGTYPTSKGRDLTLLAQAGISTDSRKPGSATIDKSRLRGYLEIDEGKLDEAIRTMPDAMKELFGSDTDGDLVVNAGVAFALDSLLKPYVTTGGLLSTRMTRLDADISDQKKEISDYTKEIADYQAEQKRKYAVMEGSLNSLEKSSESISSFSKQNSQQ